MEKIGFIARGEINDTSIWSGTVAALSKTIERKYEIVPIIIKENLIRKIFRRLSQLFVPMSLLDRRDMKRKMKQALQGGCSIFVAPAASELICDPHLMKECKIIYVSDCTYHLMVNYYWFHESKRRQIMRNRIERLALQRADHILAASEWAKDDMEQFYGIAGDKIMVAPFGANIPECRVEVKDVEHKDTIKLICCGVDWKRKGMDIAIACVKSLNSRCQQYKFELHVIGFEQPKDKKEDSSIIYWGRLNKNNSTELIQMLEIYKNGDIFILPTIAECAGVVFCEASMFGLPIFTHKTGGVSTYVEDGKNGECLELGSTGEQFADAILDMLYSGKYQKYALGAQEKYAKEICWDRWLEKFSEVVEE